MKASTEMLIVTGGFAVLLGGIEAVRGLPWGTEAWFGAGSAW